ncbi:DUF3991 domain-containing protein [Lactovum odontotermitis]
MKRLTTEQIQQAKQASILQLAEGLGISIHRVGNSKYSWRSAENSGLVFSEKKNTFFMHSALFGQPQGTGGSTIDFVQMMTHCSFTQAVKKLLQDDYSQVEIKRDIHFEKAPFTDYFKHSVDFNHQAVKDYLIGQRQLDSRIIDRLLQKNYLKEDVYHQAIFYWAKNGVKAGASVQGTTYDPERFDKHGYFKGIAKNSESNFGFNVQLGEKIERLYVFESPIDALSYWTLYPQIQNCMLASIDGTKPQCVFNFMNYLAMNHHFDSPEALEHFQVFLGMDNDAKDEQTGVKAGQRFIRHFLEMPIVRQQAPEYEHNRLFVTNSPHLLFKDWNEELQFVSQLQVQDQYIAPERHQTARIERQTDKSYQVEFKGADIPEEFQNQPRLFQVRSREEVAKLLETYDFERISKHDLEKLGYDIFNRQTIKAELSKQERLGLAL